MQIRYPIPSTAFKNMQQHVAGRRHHVSGAHAVHAAEKKMKKKHIQQKSTASEGQETVENVNEGLASAA